ncbi:YceD family protein [Lederbergia graminis]|uniref:YceD family protein n=1 Tax=Lederbergia graminis TaxID=735518 RepID=A0ABW0LEV8_9BACI
MKWTVNQLRKYRENGLKIDDYVNVAEGLKRRDSEVRGASLIHITGKAKLDSQKVTFDLHLTGSIILPCSRTLVDVDFPIDIHSTEIFLLNPQEEEFAEMDEFHHAEAGIVDLMPIIEELLILEIPIQVFSEAALENKGLQAGSDWEVMTEEQYLQDKEKKVDPRLAGLAKLLDNNNE